MLCSGGLPLVAGQIAQSGKCTIRKAGPFDGEGFFTLAWGMMISLSSSGMICFWGGIQTIPTISDLVDKPWHIASLDKDGGLVAWISSAVDLGKGPPNRLKYA